MGDFNRTPNCGAGLKNCPVCIRKGNCIPEITDPILIMADKLNKEIPDAKVEAFPKVRPISSGLGGFIAFSWRASRIGISVSINDHLNTQEDVDHVINLVKEAKSLINR